MRKKLKKYVGIRVKFTGEFCRYGEKTRYRGGPMPTVLLLHIKNESGEIVADHLWFNLTKGFASLGKLKAGDIVEFIARADFYERGYKGYDEDLQLERPVSTDIRLSYPTKIRRA